jgi:hypothetical protein
MPKRNIPHGLTSVGYQKITTNSTATTLNTTTSAGNNFLISVETQSLRVTFDGTTPVASTGILLTAANSPYWFHGIKGSTIKLKGAAVGSVVQIQAFKNVGE